MNARARGNWQGMNWIRQDKRLAIYLRDGLACCWCGASVEQGTQLTLDHVVPYAQGGVNHETNLVTACQRCNSSRGTRTVRAFAKAVAQYVDHGITPAEIVNHVSACRHRDLEAYRQQAKRLMAQRGSASSVLKEMQA